MSDKLISDWLRPMLQEEVGAVIPHVCLNIPGPLARINHNEWLRLETIKAAHFDGPSLILHVVKEGIVVGTGHEVIIVGEEFTHGMCALLGITRDPCDKERKET